MTIRQIDWQASANLPSRIYRNLNSERLMSIQQKIGKSWVVVGHVQNAVLRDVKFHVSQSGRERVVRDKRKNVHAWASAILVHEAISELPEIQPIHYCPYTQNSFSWKESGKPIEQADLLVVIDKKVYCSVDTNKSQLSLF